MKKGFTLIELLVVIAIIGILASVGLSTFTSAQTKARDAKRKSNLDQISRALEMYFNDYKKYPDDDTGRIKGCGALAAGICTWGISVFSNISVTPNTVYMIQLPKDPTSGLTYYYDAIPTAGVNTKFQLYARLENTQDSAIMALTGPSCGTGKICNYGVSSTNITPEAGRL